MDLFGNVPFVDENDRVGAFQPNQITRSDLFDYIENELKDIEPNLFDAGATEYGHATKAAAQTLLAKVYLNATVYNGSNLIINCELVVKFSKDNVYSMPCDIANTVSSCVAAALRYKYMDLAR